jgi:hypothetical protein
LARVEGFSATAFGQGTTSSVDLLDPTDTATEISKYVDPTLVRIRGFFCVDPDMVADALIHHCHVQLYLYVSQIAIASFSAAEMSRDDILWTGGFGYSRAAAWTSTPGASVALAQVWLNHPPIEVDVKAMRRLGDNSKLRLGVHVDGTTAGSSTPVDARLSYILRMLVKE